MRKKEPKKIRHLLMKNKNEMGRIANKVQFHISLELLLHLGDHDHSLI